MLSCAVVFLRDIGQSSQKRKYQICFIIFSLGALKFSFAANESNLISIQQQNVLVCAWLKFDIVITCSYLLISGNTSRSIEHFFTDVDAS